MTNSFYRSFEDKYRGSRELIKSRLEVYLPFVKPLLEKTNITSNRALDLGCGRGEWLELLTECKLNSQGVDLDEGMLAACYQRTLNVEKADALDYLKALKDSSFSVISGFHIAEHLPFNTLQEIVKHSLRVLQPGGLLILETPNPENIVTGTVNFYLDPTHERPLPPQLLSFVAEHAGFERVKVLRLQESKSLFESQDITLLDVLSGVSPDYSIVAQKPAKNKTPKEYDALFLKEYGTSLEKISTLYEKQMNNKIDLARRELKASEQKAYEKENEVLLIAKDLDIANKELSEKNDIINSSKAELKASEQKAYEKENEVLLIAKDLDIANKELSEKNDIINSSKAELKASEQKAYEKENEVLLIAKDLDIANKELSEKNDIINSSKAELKASEQKVNDLNQSSHHWWLESERLAVEIQRIYDSKSWKITLLARKLSYIASRILLKLRFLKSPKIQENDSTEICNEVEQPSIVHKKRIAIVSPFPPNKSGISEYVVELLPALSELYEVELISDSEVSLKGYTTHHYDDFANFASDYDQILYQVGNSPSHAYMFDLIKDHPGVVILHDVYLGNLVHWMQHNMKSSHSGVWDKFLVQGYGYSSIFQRMEKGEAWALDFYPVNKHILENAESVIVHSEFAKSTFHKFYGKTYDAKTFVLPQVHKGQNGNSEEKVKGDVLYCSFGHIIEQKCILEIVEAWVLAGFDKLNNHKLLFVGDYGGQEKYNDKVSMAIDSIDNIKVTDYVSNQDYQKYLKSASVAIQLRRDSKGETSRALLDCLSYGIPTVINAHGSMCEFPDEVSLKISANFSINELANSLRHIVKKDIASLFSKLSKVYINNVHRPEVVVPKLQNILNKSEGQPQLLFDKNITRHLYVDLSVVVQKDLKTGIQRVVRSIFQSLCMHVDELQVVPIYLSDRDGFWGYYVANQYMGHQFPELSGLDDGIVRPNESDIFFGLDFYAGGVSEAEKSGLFSEWRARGVPINFVVYDILPITMSDYFPHASSVGHKAWLDTIIKVSDTILCISDDVRNEVQGYIRKSKNAQDNYPKLEYFHLGADINNSTPTKGTPNNSEKTLSSISSSISFLIVGTIEPRKGVSHVIKAFEFLWNKNIEVNLVVVGKRGWDVKELMNLIEKHRKNKNFYYIESASDEYLNQIYAVSTCLIAASEGEGFGLPLIEAAQHKLPIIARDIPVFREVAGSHAYYFRNTRNPIDLGNAVVEWLATYKRQSHIVSEGMSYLSWSDSSLIVKNLIIKEKE